jgi:tricorn protease
MRVHVAHVLPWLLLPALSSCSNASSPAALLPALAGTMIAQPVQPDLAVAFPQYPALSPDAARVVFASRGDLWIVSSKGGIAQRLTNHPATERRSDFSPDGSMLAFESDRDGARGLYVMPLIPGPDGSILAGDVRRVLVMDRPVSLAGFTPDGKHLLLNSGHEPAIYRGQRMYRVPVSGGPLERLTDAFGSLPRLTPDGATAVFTYRRNDPNRPKYRGSGTSDLWSLNFATGAFAQLTSGPADEFDAYPLPDGSIVYVSSASGQNNLWTMNPAAGEQAATPLTTFAPGAEPSIGHGVRDLHVSRGGGSAAFVVWDTLYTLDLRDRSAKPAPVSVSMSSDASELDVNRTNLAREVSEAALSPDGKSIAVVARGEIFLRSTSEGRPTRRVTNTPGRERDLAWSPDGKTLYFVSDDSGVPRMFSATVAMTREDLQPPKPEPKPDEKSEAKADAKPEAKPEAKPDEKQPAAPADPAANPPPEAKPEPSEKAEKPAEPPEPDHGKRWAESLRYAIAPVATGLEADTPDFRNGIFGIEISSPMPSPDGEKLLFIRGRGDLVLHDLKSGQNRVLFESWDRPDVQWAGDNRHIVYSVSDLDFQSDVYLLDTSNADAKPINLTRHPDLDESPRLSHDGKVLYFLSERAGENGDFDVWYLFLDRSLEAMTPYELDEYFKNAGEEVKKLKAPRASRPDAKTDDKPAEKESDKPDAARAARKPAKKAEPYTFDTTDAHLRVQRLTTTGRISGLAITPAGDRVMFNSGEADRAFVSVSRKNDDRRTLLAGGGSPMGVSLTGDKVTLVARSQATVVTLASSKADTLAIDAPVSIDVRAEQRQKFREAARTIGNVFYHPTLKGLDWTALTNRYESLASRTRTPEELSRVVQMLFGELDGSHTGISASGGFSAPNAATGYLGVETSPAEQGLAITRILPGSPAELPVGGPKASLDVGDVILAVDDRPVRQTSGLIDLSTALLGKAGQETLLEIARKDPAKPRFVLIVPASGASDSRLRYQTEVQRRAALVDRLSEGTLGYLHIQGMSMPSVRDFERDLYAAAHGKDGLIIDVRDNGGGSTADILLSSLTAPAHTFTLPRGADPAKVSSDAYPRDRRLIHGYSRPISVLINENSFSNAEIFAHAIKTIGRGKLVGTATYGGVISTGAASLIDGSTVRTPFRGWYLPDGRDLENNGAQPDINVPMTPDAEAAGKDPQIEAAVKELLERAKADRAKREAVKPIPVALPK